MAETTTLTREELERVQIVLGDALPYELAMLDRAARNMQTPQFQQLKIEQDPSDWLTHNAMVEAFWTHARCLLEFFNASKRNNFGSSPASARDLTTNAYSPSAEIQKLWGPGKLSEKINEQISHVGFCRKAELYEKLGPQMGHVKNTIDKETKAFAGALRPEFQQYWKWQPRKEAFVAVYNSSGTASCPEIVVLNLF